MQKTLISPPVVGVIVVTYQPDLAALHRLLQALPSAIVATVVVHNGGWDDDACYRRFVSCVQHPRRQWVQMSGNAGIAAALNRGIAELTTLGCTHAWTFDQDSCPRPETLDILWAAWQAAGRQMPVAAVVPAIHDQGTGNTLPFLLEYPSGVLEATPIHQTQPVAAAITSGMLLDVAVWQTSGGAREDWFIDHVDTEWCFRVRAQGYGVVAVPAAVLQHELGHTRTAFYRSNRTVKVRSALRTYYMLRNGWALARLPHAPQGWLPYFWRQAWRIMLVAVVYGPNRWQQLRAMYRAWWHAQRMDV